MALKHAEEANSKSGDLFQKIGQKDQGISLCPLESGDTFAKAENWQCQVLCKNLESIWFKKHATHFSDLVVCSHDFVATSMSATARQTAFKEKTNESHVHFIAIHCHSASGSETIAH